eukprot:SAG11_NODE_581_length_8363_cov_13.931873_1_plen_127_part_10
MIAPPPPHGTRRPCRRGQVACAAGLATIDYIFEHQLMENAAAVGAYCERRMAAMMARHELIGDVRGIGLLMGIELVGPPQGNGVVSWRALRFGFVEGPPLWFRGGPSALVSWRALRFPIKIPTASSA